jgi:hypothetical protein
MSYTIPVKADLTDKDELAALLSQMEVEASGISVKIPESSGLAMDPATIALAVDVAKAIVPALISALATIWVQHIKSKKPQDKPDRKPNIVIETDAGNIRISLDTSNVEDSVLRVQLPATVEDISRIRLEA